MWNHADEIIKNMNISDIPMGTISNPFEDLEQGWQMIIFEKRGYVYILQTKRGGFPRLGVPMKRQILSSVLHYRRHGRKGTIWHII